MSMAACWWRFQRPTRADWDNMTNDQEREANASTCQLDQANQDELSIQYPKSKAAKTQVGERSKMKREHHADAGTKAK